MAKKLLNEFSWSFSRYNTFLECQKKYWYTYYGSWEGWPKTPYDSRTSIDPLASKLYLLKNIQSLAMFIGSCVHETIEWYLKNGKKEVSCKELVDNALLKFSQGIEDSKLSHYLKHPKKYKNIFEYYYKQGLENIAEKQEQAKVKIETSLTNWYNSPIVRDLIFSDQSKIVSVEELAFVMIEKLYKVIVVIDLALKRQTKDNEEIMMLFDWKTGQENEKNEKQLLLYALFANRTWNTPFDKILLTPFYVFSNTYEKIGCRQEKGITQDQIDALEKEIIENCKTLVSLVPDWKTPAIAKTPEPQNFCYTEDRRKCSRCSFQEMCQGVNYENVSQAELREFVEKNNPVLT